MASEFLYILHCVACQVWVAREGTRLSSKATTISARPTLSSLSTQPRYQSQLCLTQATSLRDNLETPCAAIFVLHLCPAFLQHTPALLLIAPTNPGNFTMHPYDHSTLHPTQRYGCTNSMTPSLRDSHTQYITLDTTGTRRLNGVSETSTGSSRGLMVKHYSITHNRCV